MTTKNTRPQSLLALQVLKCAALQRMSQRDMAAEAIYTATQLFRSDREVRHSKIVEK